MKKLALVVDDSSLARAVLKKMLLERQVAVDTVVSAEEALVYLYTHQPDVIFMDHVMPGMDGLLAVKAIKNNPKTAVIPIMMYTSKGGDMYVSQARALGAVGVLPKHLEQAELDETLTDLKLLSLDELEGCGSLSVDEVERSTGRYEGEVDASDVNAVDFDQALIADELECFFENDSIEDVADNAYQCQTSKESKDKLLNVFSQQATLFRKEMVLVANEHTNKLLERIDKENYLKHSELNISSVHNNFFPLAATLILLVLFVFSFILVSNEKGVMDHSLQLYTIENKNLKNELSALLSQRKIQSDFQVESAALEMFEKNRQLYQVIEWALNQHNSQPFNEAEFGGVSIDVLSVLLPKLKNVNFEGAVKLVSHKGRFCYNRFDEVSEPVLAASDLPLSECVFSDEAILEGISPFISQTIEFSNFISSLPAGEGMNIRIELDSKGVKFPLLSYGNAQNAGEWNAVAQKNNRLEVLILPVDNDRLVGL